MTDGAIYVATDTGTMWLGTSSTALLQITDNIDTNTTYTLEKSGSTIQLKDQSGSVVSTIDDSDTTYSNFTGATNSVAGKAGLVPAPSKDNTEQFLSGTGEWSNITKIEQTAINLDEDAENITMHPLVISKFVINGGNPQNSESGSEFSLKDTYDGLNAIDGVLVAPEIGAIAAQYGFIGKLYGEAESAASVEWQNVKNKKVMSGATASTVGDIGLVPAPSTGQQNYFLRGDGTWKEVSVSSDWDSVTNKPTFATVATSGSYEDLTNKPTIPVVPEAIKNPNALTISLNGTSQGTYDGSDAKSIDITPASIGAATSSHNHDSSYYTKTQVDSKINEVIAVQSTQPTSSNCKLWIKI